MILCRGLKAWWKCYRQYDRICLLIYCLTLSRYRYDTWNFPSSCLYAAPWQRNAVVVMLWLKHRMTWDVFCLVTRPDDFHIRTWLVFFLSVRFQSVNMCECLGQFLIINGYTFCIHCCVSVLIMDDWKLNTSPVVRLERPSERWV